MGLLNSDDLAQMRSDLAEVRGDRETSIVIRRGSTTLAAQPVRIAGAGSAQGREADGDASQEVRGRVVVLGGITLDIQPGDRFNDENGVLYVVSFVRPNRSAAVIAEAEAVE
ncbi:MAG: hypothetical protein KJ077_08130 [Anaerolineae bacterium]|nr:hypothetical protein [Anaerolineae bacterium]